MIGAIVITANPFKRAGNYYQRIPIQTTRISR
jgi:hypothetical protein